MKIQRVRTAYRSLAEECKGQSVFTSAKERETKGLRVQRCGEKCKDTVAKRTNLAQGPDISLELDINHFPLG